MKGVRSVDLTGRKFGLLRVVAMTEEREENYVVWECACECGGTKRVNSHRLTRELVRSCGCLRGRKMATDHRNRDCREAVTLALYLAKTWRENLWVLYRSPTNLRYVIHSRPAYAPQTEDGVSRKAPQNCYKVTPTGEVREYKGYPRDAELFGSKTDRIRVQFRCRATAEPWVALPDEEFGLHERHRASDRIRNLEDANQNFEYRLEE